MDSVNSITIASLNTKGVMSNFNYYAQLCHNYDIVCIQEHFLFTHNVSFLSSMGTDNRVFARCRSYVRNDGVLIRRGGIGIMWKSSLTHNITRLNDIGNDDIIGIKLTDQSNTDMYVFNVYLPSVNHSFEEFENSVNTLANIYEYYKYKGVVVIIGDINTSIKSGPRSLVSQNTDKRRSRCMESFMLENNLLSIITHDICTGPLITYAPIYGDGTQIDHILVDATDIDLVLSCTVQDDASINTSDHNAITLTLSFRSHVFLRQCRSVYKWRGTDTNVYATTLDNGICDLDLLNYNVCNNSDIDNLCNSLIYVVKNVSDECIPKSTYKSFLKPYWTKDIKLLHKEQKRLRSIWITDGRPRGMEHVSYFNYKQAKKIFAKTLHIAAEAHDEAKYDDINVAHDMDIRKFWKYVNRRKGDQYNDFCIIKDDTNTYNTPDSQRAMWFDHFRELLNEQEHESHQYDEAHKHFINEEVKRIYSISDPEKAPLNVDLSVFSSDDIRNICKALPCDKAPGVDLLTYEHFKYAGEYTWKCIAKLFNHIVQYIHVPDSFKHGILVTIYKGHGKPKDEKGSYRGVTLLPVINKIFEKCILLRMERHLSIINFPPNLQHAARKKNNNVTLSFAIQESINHHVEKKGKVFACMLDIEKAFDKIWWNGVFYKMYRLGITDKLWLLFYDWFNGSKCSLLYHGRLSDSFQISRSIKQGGVLSMYIFCIFFYDVHKFIDERQMYGLMYKDIYIGSPTLADDILLLSSTKHGIDVMMSRVLLYAHYWRITFSPSKTKCMVLGENKHLNATNINKRQFYLGEKVIEEVQHYIHIGIELCSYMSSVQRTQHMSNRGNKVLAGLSAIGVRNNYLLPTVALSLWRKVGLPSMLHGSEIWWNLNKTELAMLEKAQCVVLKSIQCFSKRTHNNVVRTAIGQQSIEACIDRNKLRFMQQLTKLNPSDLAYNIFINRLYDWVFHDIKLGFFPDIHRVIQKYELNTYFERYVHGGCLPDKICWKIICQEAIHKCEEVTAVENLYVKNDVARYTRVYNGKQHMFYKMMTRNKIHKRSLQALLKLLTIPSLPDVQLCQLCGRQVIDIVIHCIAECPNLMQERNLMWDTIINVLDVSESIDLFNRDDDDIVDIFLGKSWDKLLRKETTYIDNFYTSLATACFPLIQSICKTISWYRV